MLIPIFSLLLIIIIIGLIFTNKKNLLYFYIILSFPVFFLLFGTIGSILINTNRINKSFNKKLINHIKNNNYENVHTLSIDNADEITIKSITARGYNCKTHHSFSYKALHNEPKYDLVYTKYNIPKIFGIPTLKNIIKSLAITQTNDINTQIEYGVTQFDIRISKIGKEIYADHGIIYGTLDECIDELIEAIRKQKNDRLYHVVIKKSNYNTQDFDLNDIINNITIPDELGYKLSISNKNFNHNNCSKENKYYNTHNAIDIFELLKKEKCPTIETHLSITSIIFFSYTLLIILLTFLLTFILYQYRISRKQIKTFL